MKSNNLSAIDCQAELPIRKEPEPIDNRTIFNQKTLSKALLLAVASSGFDDIQIYMELNIDAGHWTRIKKGDAHFPLDKLNALCDFLNNEIVLIWWANSRGKKLKPLESELEKENRELREALAKEQQERKIENNLFMRMSK